MIILYTFVYPQILYIKQNKIENKRRSNSDTEHGFNKNNAQAHNQWLSHFQQSINHQLSLITLFSILSSISNNLNFMS